MWPRGKEGRRGGVGLQRRGQEAGRQGLQRRADGAAVRPGMVATREHELSGSCLPAILYRVDYLSINVRGVGGNYTGSRKKRFT